jgi:cephalosporin hydroxylase
MFGMMRAKIITNLAPLCGAILASAVLALTAYADDSKPARTVTTVEDLTEAERKLVDEFTFLFTSKTQGVLSSKWFGIMTWQHPFDLWVTQEILSEVRPDFVVEAGTFQGGSAIIWAMILEHVNPSASVITIDIEDKRTPRAMRMSLMRKKVKFLLGSSTSPKIVAEVKRRVRGKKVVLILDSLHTKSHVLDELRAYWRLVEVGSYIIVQDSAINGPHPGVRG